MTVGLAPKQADLLVGSAMVCDGRVAEDSIWAVLHRECHRLFPDEMFADLFSERGRRSVPPSIVAVVMVLQRLFGLSDREAVDAFEFDARWKYAAGGLDLDYGSFAHTVLVDMRARLDASDSPRRIFEATLEAAAAAGLVGAKRVLDSTPLYDAVATMDTVTLIRCAIRGLLKVADAALEAELRSAMTSGDDYASSSKPHIDWDDATARAALIDTRARDAYACLAHLDGTEPGPEVADAAALVARVVGQDLEEGDDGTFRIARRVAKDRVISTVDPEARHGHKTASRGFDGYKGHVATDPDSEIITDTVVTPGNAGDASVAEDLIDDLLNDDTTGDDTTGDDTTGDDTTGDDTTGDDTTGDDTTGDDTTGDDTTGDDTTGDDTTGDDTTGDPFVDVPADIYDAIVAEAEAAAAAEAAEEAKADEPTVYGDAAYGTGEFQARLHDAGIASGCKTQPPNAPGGRYTKDRFAIDLDADTVTCPNNVTVTIRRGRDGADGIASFAGACAACPLRAECTNSTNGRSIRVGPHEDALTRARAEQADPAWKADYRATRPKVERKLGHLMRRKHGGRRARVRGTRKIDADFNLLAAAVNLARLSVLGLRSTGAGGWTATA